MDWSSVWSWICIVVQWCFWGLVFYWLLKWWMRSMKDGIKLCHLETKIDTLLEHFDIDFADRFREHIAETLRESGEQAAVLDYVRNTGNDVRDGVEYVQGLSQDEKSPLKGPHFRDEDDDLELGDLQELAEKMLRRSWRKSRRKR